MLDGSDIIIIPKCPKITVRGLVDSYENGILVARSKVFVPDIKKNTNVNCLIYNKYSGKIYLEALVEDAVYSNINLKEVNILKRIQKRNEVRVDIQSPVEVHKLIVNDGIIRLDKPMLMSVRNISASGIMLESDLSIPVNIAFHLELQLNNTEEKILTLVKIIRKIKLLGVDKYGYGCNIRMLGSKDNNEIRRFVFRRLREEQRAII